MPVRLRWRLVEAAWSVGRLYPGPLGQSYRHLEPVRGKTKPAVAAARKLSALARGLWRWGEVYRLESPSRFYSRKLRELDR